GTLQLAMLFQLGLEQFEQGEGIGGGTGEAGQYLAVTAEAAHFAGIALHHRVAQGDLAVTGNGHVIAAAHADDGGGVEYVGVLTGIHGASGVSQPEVGPSAAASSSTSDRFSCGWHGAGNCDH